MLWVACARKLKKTREKKIRVAKFDNSDNGTPEGTRNTMVPASSSRRRANVHRTFAFYCSSPKYKNNPNPSPTEIRFGLFCFGTPEGTRTPNPRNRNPMLYPLSHRCVSLQLSYYSKGFWFCKEVISEKFPCIFVISRENSCF